MSAAKYRPSPGILERITGLFAALFAPLRGRGRLVAAAIGLVLAVWGASALWQHVREQVFTHDEYRLTPDEITITPQPPWVHGDIRADVLREQGLETGLSILDDQLVETLRQAFSLHPWVARVERVAKRYPAHVEVELTYRRPAAMVEVPGGLYPIDVDGVLLPTNGDFPSLVVFSYPRLAGIESTPLETVGRPWGDPIVTGGARIGAALQPHWGAFNLRAIRWVKPAAGSDSSAPALYELITAGGNLIRWGAAPGSELPG